MAQPKPKSAQLIAKIVEQLKSASPNEFEVAKLRNEAKRLEQSDAAAAAMALGMLAALVFDESSVIRNFERLLRLSPHDAIGHENYALALGRIVRSSDGLARAREAYRLAPEDSIFLENYINSAFFAGAFREAHDGLLRRQAMKLDSPFGLESRARFAFELVESAGLSDEECIQLQEMATGVLRVANAMPKSVGAANFEDDESRAIVVKYELPLPVSKVVDLEEQLSAQIASIDPPLKAAQYVLHMYSATSPP